MIRSDFVEVLGLRVHVREAGAGESVLLLHGLGVSGRYFMPLAGLLAARRHVIVPDLPGWGRSERPPLPLAVGGAAEILGELLRQRGRGAVAIVANSFGCQVALALAKSRPELVGPLAFIGPTVDPRYRSWPVHVVRLALDTLREPPALWRILLADYALMGLRRLVATARVALADRPEDLVARIRKPVLVLRGERDAICTPEWAVELASRAERGSFAQVAEAAHAAHFSHPLVVARLVETFLEEAPDRLGQLDR